MAIANAEEKDMSSKHNYMKGNVRDDILGENDEDEKGDERKSKPHENICGRGGKGIGQCMGSQLGIGGVNAQQAMGGSAWYKNGYMLAHVHQVLGPEV